MKNLFQLVFATLLIFCLKHQALCKTDKKIHIVATTGMIGDAIKNIVKDRAEVVTLMGPGVDPHLYKATQGDLKKFTSADIIFYNGLHLEGKMGEVFKKLQKRKPVYAVGDAIDDSKLIKDENFSIGDPHIWFDVSLWIDVVKYINQVLQKHYPENKDFYAHNTQQYIQQLDTLNLQIKALIQKIPKEQRVLITAHDAFHYFGRAYDIEVRGLQGISTLAEYGLKDITNMVNFIIQRKIKAVFIESAVPDKPLKATIEGCKQQGHDLKLGGELFADAMGQEGTFEGTYIGMVYTNVQTIIKGLLK